MLASGILGYSTDTFESIQQNGAGAIVTKSVGLRSRKGYANPTVVQAEHGLINAMGLPNPGINEFVKEIRLAKKSLRVPLVVSVYGFSAEEYGLVAGKAVAAGADAVELNVSCPHVKGTGSEIGQDCEVLSGVVRRVKETVSKSVFVKLSPNVTRIQDVALAAERAGADGLTVANTIRAMAIDAETCMPVLSNRVGGLSGPAVKPVALRCVYDVYEVAKVPIIGCGGTSNWKDAVEFLLAGACAVQIGTAVATEGPGVFGKVARGLDAYLRRKGFKSVKEIVGVAHRK